MLMEAVLLSNLQKGLHEVAVAGVMAVVMVAVMAVVMVVLVSFLEEVRRQGQGGASIVGLTGIGPETVKPVTGRTSVIDVENAVI